MFKIIILWNQMFYVIKTLKFVGKTHSAYLKVNYFTQTIYSLSMVYFLFIL